MGENEFRGWAVVEVMGHNEYAGYVTAELIARAPMLRVDVPAVSNRDAFSKYLLMGAIYGITPCTEETAKARASAKRAVPFESWSVEKQVMENLKSRGLLLDKEQLVDCRASHIDGDHRIDDDDD